MDQRFFFFFFFFLTLIRTTMETVEFLGVPPYVSRDRLRQTFLPRVVVQCGNNFVNGVDFLLRLPRILTIGDVATMFRLPLSSFPLPSFFPCFPHSITTSRARNDS